MTAAVCGGGEGGGTGRGRAWARRWAERRPVERRPEMRQQRRLHEDAASMSSEEFEKLHEAYGAVSAELASRCEQMAGRSGGEGPDERGVRDSLGPGERGTRIQVIRNGQFSGRSEGEGQQDRGVGEGRGRPDSTSCLSGTQLQCLGPWSKSLLSMQGQDGLAIRNEG